MNGLVFVKIYIGRSHTQTIGTFSSSNTDRGKTSCPSDKKSACRKHMSCKVFVRSCLRSAIAVFIRTGMSREMRSIFLWGRSDKIKKKMQKHFLQVCGKFIYTMAIYPPRYPSGKKTSHLFQKQEGSPPANRLSHPDRTRGYLPSIADHRNHCTCNETTPYR